MTVDGISPRRPQPALTPGAAQPTFPGFTMPAGYTAGPSMMDVIQGTSHFMRGQAHPDIKLLQQALNAAGANPPLAVDGLYGPKTEAMVRGILGQADGRFGRDGLLALQRAANFSGLGDADGRTFSEYGVNLPANRARGVNDRAPEGTTRAHDFQQADAVRRGNAERAGGRGPGNEIQLNVPWFSQFDGANVEGAGSTACYRATRSMGRAAGIDVPPGTGNRIQVATGEDSVGRVQTTRARTDAARGYIDQQLEAGRPVVVGVSHKDADYNQDKITDHFVMITGRGVDAQGRQFYSYHDPATTDRGTGTNQRFYVDPNSGNLVHQGSLASGLVVNRHTEMSMVVRSN
jgi:peptidoglycan hydrolase-like protein with peptidoglycan-binding domain